MSLKVSMMAAPMILGALFVSAAPTTAQSQSPLEALARPIVVEPVLVSERSTTHPGLHLLISNRGTSSIPGGRTIRFTYQTKDLNGEGKVELVNSLLSGQGLDVSVSEVKAESFRTCSATLINPTMIEGPSIKLPYIFAPRKP